VESNKIHFLTVNRRVWTGKDKGKLGKGKILEELKHAIEHISTDKKSSLKHFQEKDE